MHHQNPVVPPESGVHLQNPVCTYSVIVLPGHGCVNNGDTAVWTMGHDCVQVPGYVEGHPWNKRQWNFNRNSNISIQENAFENVVCKKWRPFCLGVIKERRNLHFLGDIPDR